MVWMDTHRKCIYSSCFFCIIKVSSMNNSGLFLPPPPNLKLGEKIKEKTLSSLSSRSPLSLFIVQYLYNPVICVFLCSPLLARLPPPRPSFASSERWSRRLKQDLSLDMVDAHCPSG